MSPAQKPVLLCYDGSPGSARAVEAGCRLFAGRPALVVCVWSSAHVPDARTTHVERVRQELVEEVRMAMHRDAKAVVDAGVELAERTGLAAEPLLVESDHVADALVQTAEQRSAAAVVIGRPHQSVLARLTIGGVAHSLLARWQGPVVLA